VGHILHGIGPNGGSQRRADAKIALTVCVRPCTHAFLPKFDAVLFIDPRMGGARPSISWCKRTNRLAPASATQARLGILPQAVSSVSMSGSACRDEAPEGACPSMAKPVDNAAINPVLPEPKPRDLKPLTVTVATACKITGLGNTTLWGLVRDRRLETVRIGRRTLITFRSLEALVAPLSEPDRQPHQRGRPRKLIGGHKS
jgi:excisionase family DNA binding protein